MAKAVVDMKRAMGRSTEAEGVETAGQFPVLRGVDAYQGRLFAKPLAADKVAPLPACGRLETPTGAQP